MTATASSFISILNSGLNAYRGTFTSDSKIYLICSFYSEFFFLCVVAACLYPFMRFISIYALRTLIIFVLFSTYTSLNQPAPKTTHNTKLKLQLLSTKNQLKHSYRVLFLACIVFCASASAFVHPLTAPFFFTFAAQVGQTQNLMQYRDNLKINRLHAR